MIQRQEVNETNIKDALTQGYITKKEAHQMLNVYLHKVSFSKCKSQKHKTALMHN